MDVLLEHIHHVHGPRVVANHRVQHKGKGLPIHIEQTLEHLCFSFSIERKAILHPRLRIAPQDSEGQ